MRRISAIASCILALALSSCISNPLSGSGSPASSSNTSSTASSSSGGEAGGSGLASGAREKRIDKELAEETERQMKDTCQHVVEQKIDWSTFDGWDHMKSVASYCDLSEDFMRICHKYGDDGRAAVQKVSTVICRYDKSLDTQPGICDDKWRLELEGSTITYDISQEVCQGQIGPLQKLEEIL